MWLVSNFAEEVGTFDDENDKQSEGDVALSKVVDSLLCYPLLDWDLGFFFSSSN